MQNSISWFRQPLLQAVGRTSAGTTPRARLTSRTAPLYRTLWIFGDTGWHQVSLEPQNRPVSSWLHCLWADGAHSDMKMRRAWCCLLAGL